jgi:phage head maturation protease
MPPRPRLRTDRLVRFDLAPTPAGSAAPAVPAAGPAGLVVPWNVEAVRFGVRVAFTDETTQLPTPLDVVKLLIQHDDERPVGYALTASRDPDGLRMSFASDPAHPRAAELAQEIALGWRDGFSVGIDLDEATWNAIWDAAWDGQADDAPPIPLAGVLREVSAVSLPQFTEARVGAAAPPLVTFHREEPAMPPAPVLDAAAPTDPGSPAPEALSMAELATQLAPHLLAHAAGGHPLAAFSSLGEFLIAAREGNVTDAQRAAFVLADQVTTDNPGVMPPTWLTTIVGILDRGRPTVSAFGGPSSAGSSGLVINWPYYDGGFADLVAKQVTEKTEVHSRKVSIKDTNAALETYAGASDISYQLLRRSSPSYREAYSRILTIGYGVTTDAAFATQVLAQATPAAGGSWTTGQDLEALLAALFAASSQVDDAVGLPADLVLASPDMFAAIGVLAGLVPGQYGTQNVGGTSSASTLRISVSGLDIRKDRSLPADTLLVSNSEAASWAEDGPFPVSADDVAKLGQDVGIWGMGVGMVTVPAGIVAVGAPVTPLSRSSAK